MTPAPPSRRIFGNRTLNLRSIKAVGYDMDYTLIHYRVEEWERRAFEYMRGRLADRGWPVDDLNFDPDDVIRGLTIDLELGNLVKPTRFGYVIRAAHGTRLLGYEKLRNSYDGTFVDLSEERFVFLNTLFSMSEASMFAQLVDLLDAGALPGVLGYSGLYEVIDAELSETHMAGRLKAEIAADPEPFVVTDPDVVLALQDQRAAGKRLLLITNSEWEYTRTVMSYAFDPFIDDGTWRDLFDAVVVSADKPSFFSRTMPLYRIVDEDAALLRPHFGDIEPGAVFVGGCAPMIEESLGVAGGDILYVGDHLYADVSVSKAVLRWRTALILRELEDEIAGQLEFAEGEIELTEKMHLKADLEADLAAARLDKLRASAGHAPPEGDPAQASSQIDRLQSKLTALDDEISPLARTASVLANPKWGPLMRSGSDKSLFARQVERYADVYTSRVSNFLHATPYAFLRAARGTLPHDDPQ